jgi:hypothetical protein
MSLSPEYYATSRKVAGSISDGVIEIFDWHNLCGRTMVLGSTLHLTEMSTRNISWGGEGGRCLGLTPLPLLCANCLEIWEIWEPQPFGTLRALSRPVMGLLYVHRHSQAVQCCWIAWLWRWRHWDRSKRRKLSTNQHVITDRKILIFRNTGVRTSYFTNKWHFCRNWLFERVKGNAHCTR